MTDIKEENAKLKRQHAEAVDSVVSKKQKVVEKSDSKSNDIEEPTTKDPASKSSDDLKKENDSLVGVAVAGESEKALEKDTAKELKDDGEEQSRELNEEREKDSKDSKDSKEDLKIESFKDGKAELDKYLKEGTSIGNDSKSTSTFVFGKNSKFGATAFASLKGKQSVFGPPTNIFGNSLSAFGAKSEPNEGMLSTTVANTMMKSDSNFVFGAGSKYANAFKKSADSTKSIFDSSKISNPNSNNDFKDNEEGSEGSKSSSSILESQPNESSTLYQAVKLEKQVVSSGEEEETSIIQMKAKLYVLENIKTGWKERGVGILHVNKKNSSGDTNKDGKSFNTASARIVMRTMNVLKLVLNVSIAKPPAFEIFKGMESSLSSEKFIRFNNFELGNDDKAKLVQYAVRVGTAEAAQELYNTIKQFI